MSYGYSQHIADLNKRADASSLGVALGRACINTHFPVTDIAAKLGVSRTTIYNWFTGVCLPHPKYHAAINKLLKRFS
jgi:hypothetical protein